ncbi:hypothetical protein LTR40_004630 [Exophiala xenobiotica]|nr:hypothetical protein LTR40_004630 [Exophiala xenobiotica]
MSWFTSLFSPAQSPATPSSSQVPSGNKRLLEEPALQPEPEPVVEAPKPSIPQTTQPTQLEQQKGKVILGAGLAFFAVSLLITRRSFARKRLATNPAFYANAPAHQAEQAQKVSVLR